MQLETKFFLIFGAIALFVIFMGAGDLSLQEARSKANKTRSSLGSDQLDKLVKTQEKFTEVAYPICSKATDKQPNTFTIVIELNSEGHVGRLWKQGDSEFVLCLQKLMQDNFIFRPFSQPFFILFEYPVGAN